MATSPPFFVPIHTIVTQKPGVYIANSSHHKLLGTLKFGSVKTKAAGDDQNTKPGSLICADCDGNGAVLCSQCKGGGVNFVDHFNGQFKAGDSCWLCGFGMNLWVGLRFERKICVPDAESQIYIVERLLWLLFAISHAATFLKEHI